MYCTTEERIWAVGTFYRRFAQKVRCVYSIPLLLLNSAGVRTNYIQECTQMLVLGSETLPQKYVAPKSAREAHASFC